MALSEYMRKELRKNIYTLQDLTGARGWEYGEATTQCGDVSITFDDGQLAGEHVAANYQNLNRWIKQMISAYN